jgi:hypothetical protein
MTLPDSTLPDPEVYVQHGSRYYYSAEQMHAYAAAYLEAAIARGIVTRQGEDPQGLRGEAIEPGHPKGDAPNMGNVSERNPH